jgi:putative inorganic carbon (hco3(-)) transporter
VIAFAALTGPLPKAGVVVLAGLVGLALIARTGRTEAGAMLGALALSPVLLLVEIWHSPQLGAIHRHPLLAVAGGVVALAAICAVAIVFARRPPLFAAAVVVAVPFRIPIQAGGSTANLLVPLYFVVAAGALGFIVPALRTRARGERRAPGWIERLLALYVVIYGLQATYSTDFEKALQNMVFFYAPFALMFCLLLRLRWTPRLIRACLALAVVLALVFAVIGFGEYATKTLLLNPKLVAANAVHTYFTVNSVFFDANIFGRFLALVMILVATVLLYARARRDQLVSIAVLAVLWAGLVLTLSRSSLLALLVGLGVLVALRWRVVPVLAVTGAVCVIAVTAVAVSPTTFGLNQGINGASSGRGSVVSGGIQLWKQRPLWGYGSGAFEHEYQVHHPQSALLASHTIPITVAAEQGLIGELAYLALVIVALVVLLRGAGRDPVRAAVGAALLALIFHTMLYADFLEDPITWALLGLGAALATQPRERAGHIERRGEPLAAVAA